MEDLSVHTTVGKLDGISDLQRLYFFVPAHIKQLMLGTNKPKCAIKDNLLYYIHIGLPFVCTAQQLGS